MANLNITPDLSNGGSLPATAYPLRGPADTAAAPNYSWTDNTDRGVFNDTVSGGVGFAVAATQRGLLNANGLYVNGAMNILGTASLGFTSGVYTSALDVILARDAANTLALRNGNAAQEYRVYAGNGGFISNVRTVTESLTIAAAATTVSATTIPAGAILLGVSVRVTTVIPTAATFTVTTTTGGTTLNTAAVSTAATSTDPGTAAGASYRAASTTVTITPNLTPGAATGVVRLQYYYLQITPATS